MSVMSFLSNHQPRNRLVRLAAAEVRAAGFEPVVLEGKAYRVRWVDGVGQPHVVPISRSPSRSSQERFVLSNIGRALRASKNGRA
jgi:hypothetical protein